MKGQFTARLATTAAAFDAKYRDDPDPWKFATSVYERERFRHILSALMRPRYRAAFEPGCSTGELTALLAARCDSVLATDISPSASERAAGRCADLDGVTVRCEALSTGSLPSSHFDLIVFSEMGYYFERHTLQALASALQQRLWQGGELLAAHWLGTSSDHVLHGDAVHEVLSRAVRMRQRLARRFAGFRIDSWVKS